MSARFRQSVERRRRVSALTDLVAGSGARRIAFLGLAKNVGKTTALVGVLAELARRGVLVGTTSAGRDGEEFDAITGEPKPRFRVAPGQLVASAASTFEAASFPAREIATLPFTTRFGPIQVRRAEDHGEIEVIGPATASQLAGTAEALESAGAQLLLLDGAVGRRAFAGARVSDGVVLSVGMSAARDAGRARLGRDGGRRARAPASSRRGPRGKRAPRRADRRRGADESAEVRRDDRGRGLHVRVPLAFGASRAGRRGRPSGRTAPGSSPRRDVQPDRAGSSAASGGPRSTRPSGPRSPHAGVRSAGRPETLSHVRPAATLTYTFGSMTPKLGLSPERIARCRSLARSVADGVRRETEPYTTVATERTVLRLLGVDGVDSEEVPVPNRVVAALASAGRLSRGAAVWIGQRARGRRAQRGRGRGAAVRSGVRRLGPRASALARGDRAARRGRPRPDPDAARGAGAASGVAPARRGAAPVRDRRHGQHPRGRRAGGGRRARRAPSASP